MVTQEREAKKQSGTGTSMLLIPVGQTGLRPHGVVHCQKVQKEGMGLASQEAPQQEQSSQLAVDSVSVAIVSPGDLIVRILSFDLLSRDGVLGTTVALESGQSLVGLALCTVSPPSSHTKSRHGKGVKPTILTTLGTGG